MTGRRVKIGSTEEKLLVGVRRKNAKMLDSRRISVFWGLSGRFICPAAEQTGRNRDPECGIIDCIACRSSDYELKWQIPR